MVNRFFLFAFLFINANYCVAQDTFSIVAVDSATREVGSAGASCIAGSIIISDVHPDRGAIHTQAWYYSLNQNRASEKMDSGYSPQYILDWLFNNDAGGWGKDSSMRQYGIVDFDSSGKVRSAAYTGVNCDDYKNHIVGYNYSIQGNILLGQQILDSMEAKFINTQGTLSDKLMAALQGANVTGADTRCMSVGKPSLSAFLRVAKKDDFSDDLYLDLNINDTINGVNPIDSLQILYDKWKIAQSADDIIKLDNENQLIVFPNPFNSSATIQFKYLRFSDNATFKLLDINGKTIIISSINAQTKSINITRENISKGLYFYQVIQNSQNIATGKMIVN